MKGIFVHHPLFRILFPPIYGTLVYVLVLLAFDSILQLEENFFSQEAFLCIGLTYGLSESLRLVLRGINRLFPEFKSIQRRIFIYLAANLSCSLVLISVGVAAYFKIVLESSAFFTELLTLNFIFLVTTVLYTLVYFGVYYLNHYNCRRLEQETALRSKMEYQLHSLQRDINPGLLYSSLETLISLVHTNPDEADNYIDCLSKIYRYALENRRQELVPLNREVESAQNLVHLFNYAYQNCISLNINPDIAASKSLQLVPGTLQKLIEQAVNRSLISGRHPLAISVLIMDGTYLELHYALHARLLPLADNDLIPELTKAYAYFSDQAFEYSEENDLVWVRIPLIPITTDIPQLVH